MDEPEAKRLSGRKAFRAQKVASRLTRADRLDDIRTNGRRDKAELGLGQREYQAIAARA